MIKETVEDNPISKEAAKQKDALKDISYLLNQIVEIDRQTLDLMSTLEYFKYYDASSDEQKEISINHFVEMYDSYYILFNTKENRYEITDDADFDYLIMSFGVLSPIVFNKARKNSYTELNMKFLLGKISETEFKNEMGKKLKTYLKKEINDNYLKILEKNKKWSSPVIPENSKIAKLPVTNYLEAMKHDYNLLSRSIDHSFVWKKRYKEDPYVYEIIKNYAINRHSYDMLYFLFDIKDNMLALNSEEKFSFLKNVFENIYFSEDPINRSMYLILEIFTKIVQSYRLRNSEVFSEFKYSLINIIYFVKEKYKDHLDTIEESLMILLRKNDLNYQFKSYIMQEFFPNKKLLIRLQTSDDLEITESVVQCHNLIFGILGFIDLRYSNYKLALKLAENKMLATNRFSLSNYRGGTQTFLLHQKKVYDTIKANDMELDVHLLSEIQEQIQNKFPDTKFMFS